MQLPVMPPLKPMLAKSVPDVPEGTYLFEPKWDGFRCIVFRDGDEVELGSRNEKPLTRYFPEVVEAVKTQLPARCVVDGEIVIAAGKGLDFEALLQRIHPAASRVATLSQTTPASFVAFDLLALDDESLMKQPQSSRRARLEQALATSAPPVHLTPATTDAALARDWFTLFEGAGLDGVMAKPTHGIYTPDKRTMLKIKHARTADCVVGAFRWHKSGPVVGSLVLGLQDDAGGLQHVGVAAAFPMARRKELVEELEPYLLADGEPHPWLGEASSERAPGGEPSRWNRAKDMSFVPLRPELVVEVAYDHMEGARFRHTAQFRSWRPDRDASSCTYAQLERPVRFDLGSVLGA
ncbi:MAG: ATP-dependent DNA ligase [Actinomycetota bacterium]|nr:ATP-dependent DNA ligase [Actinomycetota bacterium]